jgi:hypothetical protein
VEWGLLIETEALVVIEMLRWGLGVLIVELETWRLAPERVVLRL